MIGHTVRAGGMLWYTFGNESSVGDIQPCASGFSESQLVLLSGIFHALNSNGAAPHFQASPVASAPCRGSLVRYCMQT